jgi:prepilin-type N-terminal cleavage/methylation domain-containing protein
MSARTERARRARGFTLLEVLAAVAVLAIVYTSLARAAMQGLANQGDAARRLRASILADEALGQVEALLTAGSAPPLGESELPSEDPDFTVTVEVRAFEDLATALSAAAAPEEGRLARRPRPAADAESGQTPTPQLLVAAPGGAPPLLEIDVRVRWIEGANEQEVTRTSFGADPTIVGNALAGLGEGDEQGDETEGETEGETETQRPQVAPGGDAGSELFPGQERAP